VTRNEPAVRGAGKTQSKTWLDWEPATYNEKILEAV
jgi:hypothetical protein